MTEHDLRPPTDGGVRPAAVTSSAGPRWWEPLTTKWGLLGTAIFISLAVGLWDSGKEKLFPGSNPVAQDPAEEIRKLAERCRKIEDFAKRAECETPVEAWNAEQRRIQALKYRADEAERQAKAKREAEYTEFRRVSRASEGAQTQLLQQFADFLANGKENFPKMAAMESTVSALYVSNRNIFPSASSDDQRRITDDLASVPEMPFERAASLILRSLGQVDEATIRKALRDLKLERALGKPELLGVLETNGKRLPLFPQVPKLLPPPHIISINDKPLTPEEQRWHGQINQKQALQRSISGIYRDCEEHYRPLYTQHLRALFQTYMSGFTVRVDQPPQDVTYPLFLLGPEATPNERLGGAIVVLWQGKLTPAAEALLSATPEAIFATGCAADRRDFKFLAASQVPAGVDRLSLAFKPLSKADVARIPDALRSAYNDCRPAGRAFYFRTVRTLAINGVALMDRASRGDEGLLKQLQSTDRSTLFKAVEQAFAAPSISSEIAAVLPDKAAAAFADYCPSMGPQSQLRAFREDQAADEVRAKEFDQKLKDIAKGVRPR
jgi:hypothetical protein